MSTVIHIGARAGAAMQLRLNDIDNTSIVEAQLSAARKFGEFHDFVACGECIENARQHARLINAPEDKLAARRECDRVHEWAIAAQRSAMKVSP